MLDVPDRKTLVSGSNPVNEGVQEEVDRVLLDSALEVLSGWAEGFVGWPFRWDWLGIKPLLPISEVGVQHAWIPVSIRCKVNCRKGVPFSIGVWAHGKAWESINNVKWNLDACGAISDGLFTANQGGFVRDDTFVPLKLARTDDTVSLAGVAIVV